MPLLQTSGNVTADGYGGGVAAVPQYIEDVFSTYLYTGNGSTQTITNGIDLSTKGGLVWLKMRNFNQSHLLFDTIRGTNNYLQSNATDEQYTLANSLTAFNTTGFTVGSGASTNAEPYASWTFRKQPKFFDVVTYTGDGTTGKVVNHSLGSAPACILVKLTSSAGSAWQVWHRNDGTTAKIGQLNSASSMLNAAYSASPNLTFLRYAPTSTDFTLKASTQADANACNASGETYVAYLFAHNAGGFGLTGTDNVISCGSFTTDGSGNATVNLGYEPQWVLTKCTGTAGGDDNGDWRIVDSMRGFPSPATNVTYAASSTLFPNTSGAEAVQGFTSCNSTGFGAGQLQASKTYIYIAIRRGPMKVPTSGTSVFSPVARTGTGSATTISGVGFAADLLWDGVRNTAGYGNFLLDKLRGGSQRLGPYTTAAEVTESPAPVTQFGNTSINISGSGTVNDSGVTYVNWLFQRAPSFFDEVCYTGTGSQQNITHNLGVAPELMIVKRRSAASGSWATWATSLTSDQSLALNTTDDKTAVFSVGFWGSTYPTSSVFTVGSNINTNSNTVTYVAYLFATCAGVSKVGSYTGNGSTQTINCGFTGGARFVLIKRTDSTGDWYVYDTARGMTVLTDPYLLLNSTAAESATLGSVTTVSTGFAVDASILAAVNTNAASYIFLAVA